MSWGWPDWNAAASSPTTVKIASQNRVKGAAQGFVTEHEAVAQRLVRNHALASEQQLIGKVAAEAPQQRIRNAEPRRPVQAPRQLLGECIVGHGDRRGGVDGPRNV